MKKYNLSCLFCGNETVYLPAEDPTSAFCAECGALDLYEVERIVGEWNIYLEDRLLDEREAIKDAILKVK